MRSCLVALFLLASVWPAAAQSVVEEWIFDGEGAQLEGVKDHTLRPWPVDLGAVPAPYFVEFTPGDAGLDFAPSFRIIAVRNDDRAGTSRVGSTSEDSGVVTYRYDTKRRKFTVRHGLSGRES